MQDTATGQSFEPAAPAISLGDLSVGSAEQTGDAAKAAAAEAMRAATQRAVEILVGSFGHRASSKHGVTLATNEPLMRLQR